MATLPLFAYGTLLPDLCPPPMSAIVARLTPLSPATVHAKLYDLGAYPGLVLCTDPTSIVHGHLLSVPTDLWPTLDAYESTPTTTSPEGLFLRTTTTATLPDGRAVQCYIYTYPHDCTNAPQVPSGSWRTHFTTRRPR